MSYISLRECIRRADNLLISDPDLQLFQKFDCDYCGQTCYMEEANTFYESGECYNCKKVTEIKECGFMLTKGLRI